MPPVLIHDPFGDRQSESGTADISIPHFTGTVKPLKDMGNILFDHTNPRILYGKETLFSLYADRKQDLVVFFRVFSRIVS